MYDSTLLDIRYFSQSLCKRMYKTLERCLAQATQAPLLEATSVGLEYAYALYYYFSCNVVMRNGSSTTSISSSVKWPCFKHSERTDSPVCNASRANADAAS